MKRALTVLLIVVFVCLAGCVTYPPDPPQGAPIDALVPGPAAPAVDQIALYSVPEPARAAPRRRPAW